MFKKCFELYKKDIHECEEYNYAYFDDSIQIQLMDHKNIITYTENIIKNKSKEQQRHHFFYLLDYNDGDDPTYWFEAINLSKLDFIDYILEDVESCYVRPLTYINDCSLEEWDSYKVKNFRGFLKKHFFDNNLKLVDDYFINFKKSIPSYHIYNALGEIDTQISNIIDLKKEEIQQHILKYLVLQPLSLKSMCWVLLPHTLQDSVRDRILL
tara:strand:- start:403 stop:1035 length:633 start_codon:yes stop_codon:yes gene_type:complete